MLLCSVPISLHTPEVLLCQRQGQEVDPRCCIDWDHMCGMEGFPCHTKSLQAYSPHPVRMQVFISPHQTPFSSSRSSTHLPILKLLQGVDTLKGPRLDSLRLLDQLRAQDWEGEGGKGTLTFNHLKVGWFCWLTSRAKAPPLHKNPNKKGVFLQGFGVCQPMAVSGKDVCCCQPRLESFDPSSLH